VITVNQMFIVDIDTYNSVNIWCGGANYDTPKLEILLQLNTVRHFRTWTPPYFFLSWLQIFEDRSALLSLEF